MKATSLVQVQNDRVIVTEWRFAPGAETGHHVHPHDYVVVPRARPAGIKHNVINATDYEFRFVEIELL
jgi:quercetin dioxygenase-like cupin family protein